ncbi:[citrate (pro-3S)-lyase] ligase [Actinobacillus succinogenes]|uniref:[Citrate [pro-3S]-lyase] ligase n=1 Tax=Actinobacillus succinogenes (strain ATCC 55618 / DSM 22257 / CCUG 43843 / 130Z) TaxID=339671 RepID=A6VL36_ACTSZ|nr:[citrate (pro-3S)-lyase] ligase [Actinobacillus succinogenes]ABR73683.1 citrate lyase ligase [Actinobacillus succinogenes 130Z]PHI39858.1 [citrate (pro-3S)-lyase] ligase [Actinobacillus succinogenes]
MSYNIGKVNPLNHKELAEIDRLLAQQGIRRDQNLDYTCAMYDEDDNIIATGSLFANSLRCLAVSEDHQGEGLMNQIVTHLINEQFERGHFHLFLYTKSCAVKFFSDLSFYEIAKIEGKIAFMENRRNGFADYLQKLVDESPERQTEKRIAAIVMNANPFTLGHQYLVEKAAAENDIVHLFMVSEDQSLVPFDVRRKLILEGVAHLPNVVCHDSGSYIISSATFPSYFQKDDDAVIESNALVDVNIFVKIARKLGIKRRYVGDEPFSHVTHIYNKIMQRQLPEYDIECIVLERKTVNGQIISASAVRQAIKDEDWDKLKVMLPVSSLRFFESNEAKPIINKIKQTSDVSH